MNISHHNVFCCPEASGVRARGLGPLSPPQLIRFSSLSFVIRSMAQANPSMGLVGCSGGLHCSSGGEVISAIVCWISTERYKMGLEIVLDGWLGWVPAESHPWEVSKALLGSPAIQSLVESDLGLAPSLWHRPIVHGSLSPFKTSGYEFGTIPPISGQTCYWSSISQATHIYSPICRLENTPHDWLIHI